MIAEPIVQEIVRTLQDADRKTFDQLVRQLMHARRLFVSGVGRSGLVGQMFAMRLMHLGQTVYVAGETVTPAIGSGDTLICLSASGTTAAVVRAAELAHRHGAEVVALTASPHSRLASLSRFVAHLRHASPEGSDAVIRGMPMGTRFELAALIYLEAIVFEWIHLESIDEATMRSRHANLE